MYGNYSMKRTVGTAVRLPPFVIEIMLEIASLENTCLCLNQERFKIVLLRTFK